MPGIATRFEILRLTLERLHASGDPALDAVANAMEAEPVYAHLGAIGPVLTDFMPADNPPPPGGPLDYALVWKYVFGLVGNTPGTPGLYDTLTRTRAMLDQLEQIATTEDIDALCDLKDTDFMDQLEQVGKDFADLVAQLEGDALIVLDIIGTGLRPAFCGMTQGDPLPDPKQWPVRDLLHWSRTGQFLEKLLGKAAATGDGRLRAYAYGYAVSYAASVCGAPFVNSIVGGPSRTQWWRQRFIKNYVDAWVHGYYGIGATMTGDTPSPPYEDWPNLCKANLQQKIQLAPLDPVDLLRKVKTAKPLPEVLPSDFTDAWFAALDSTYGNDRPTNIDAADLNGAYVMTWLVLWFQTSGAVLGCDLHQPVAPPDDCGDDPNELDPFQTAPGSGPTLPPEPSIDYDVDEAAVVCGVILALFGVLSLLGGGMVAGGITIGAAVEQFDCESVVEFNWKSLRCQLYWYRKYLYNGLAGFQRLLAIAGLGYPDTETLNVDEVTLDLIGLPFEAGRKTVKSRGRKEEDFPSKCWDGSPVTFNARPTTLNPGFEKPPTVAYIDEAYPSFFVDDDTANPLGNGDVKTDGSFPFRPDTPSAQPIQFGNAVANAVDLLADLGARPPDWNLDGDRGLAYMTWRFNGFYDPNNVQIVPE